MNESSFYLPLTHACTLITLSYIALKVRNLWMFERMAGWMVPLFTGTASIIMMVLPFPDDTLLIDLHFAPIVMAGLRYGWRISLFSILLPVGWMLALHNPDWIWSTAQDLILPAIISSLFHRKEYDSGYSPIRLTDGLSLCGFLTAAELLLNGKLHYASGPHFWLMHVYMLIISCASVTLLILMLNDENKAWMLQRKLELEAKQDSLTRLPNLRGFMEIASRTIRNRPVSILMIDIDNFKYFNDSHGHLVGDQLLREAGQLLKMTIREQDYVARYGGEEFIILSHTVDQEELAWYAGKLCKAVEGQPFCGMDGASTTISIGISITHYPNGSLQRLIAEADQALYASKHTGKNRFTFYEEHESAMEPIAQNT